MSEEAATEDARGASYTQRVGERLAAVDSRTYQVVFFVGLLVWLSYLFVRSLPWNWTNKLFPWMVILPSGLFVLLKLVKLRYPARYAALLPSTGDDDTARSRLEESYQQARSGGDTAVRSRAQQLAYAVRLLAWMIALPVLVYVVGLANALPIYLVAFGLRFSKSPVRAVLNAVVYTVLMYLFFFVIMGMPDYAGSFGLPSVLSLFGLG